MENITNRATTAAAQPMATFGIEVSYREFACSDTVMVAPIFGKLFVFEQVAADRYVGGLQCCCIPFPE